MFPHQSKYDSETADAIVEFVVSLEGSPTSLSMDASKTQEWVTNGIGIVGASALAASLAADWLPTF
jgi:hypothetical protein